MTATTTSARVLGVATAISAAAVVAGPVAVAVPGGLLLAFALPGSALTGVMFRRAEVSAVERVVLAPALSLATLIVSGLLMNAAGIELDRVAWTSATAGVTLLALFAGALPARRSAGTAAAGTTGGGREPALAAVAAAIRAATAGPGDQGPGDQGPGDQGPGDQGAVDRGPGAFSPGDTVRLVVAPPVTGPEPGAPTGDGTATADPGAGGGWSLVRQLLPLVLAVLVVGGAAWLSYDSSRGSATRTVTTLSATTPGTVSADGTHVVRVTADGLVSAEGPFTIDVRDGAGLRLERREITPVDGSWTAELSLPGTERVTVDLLRPADTTPYRTVIIAAAG